MVDGVVRADANKTAAEMTQDEPLALLFYDANARPAMMRRAVIFFRGFPWCCGLGGFESNQIIGRP